MKGLKRFESALARYSSAVAMQVVQSSKAATTTWMRGVLLGSEPTKRPTPPTLRRDDLFIVKLLRAFSEVDASAGTLDVIAKLARRSPSKAIQVEPGAHLRFFVEAYLNEIYLLSQRCEALSTFLQRAYRKDARAGDVARSTASIQKHVSVAFKPMLGVRGAHVHEFRYDDFDVSRLGTLRILGPTDRSLARIHKDALRKVRRKKVQWMVANNRGVQELLDWYFDALFDLVFDEAGVPKYPVAAKAG
jgi:hypothetical protein